MLAARTTLFVAVLLGIGFTAGYFFGRGPRWALWENVGTTVRATTAFYSTRSGCTKTRDEWNKREETKREAELEKWRKENPNPRGFASFGPIGIYVGYECFPVGVNPGAQRFPRPN